MEQVSFDHAPADAESLPMLCISHDLMYLLACFMT